MKKIFARFFTLSFIGFTMLLSGCAGTTIFLTEDFCSKPINNNMARIVLDRKSGFYAGSAGPIRILDDEQPIGDIGPGGHVCWDRHPGSAHIRGTNAFSGNELCRSTIDTQAGSTYNLFSYTTMTGCEIEIKKE